MNIPLEQQLQELARLGLRLNANITIEDLFLSFDRPEYEKAPYSILLQIMGTEVEGPPWGRRYSDDVWTLDTECVNDVGDVYVRVIQSLARVAGQSERISNAAEVLDLVEEIGLVSYTLDGQSKTWDVEIQDDWLDLMLLGYIAAGFEREGRFFAASWGGQTACIVFTDEQRMADLQRLTGSKFERLNP